MSARQFHDRHFPVRPNLEQLKHQAKDLLRAIHRGDPAAVAELHKHHPKAVDHAKAKLADSQLALARSYGLPSWPRLVQACRMTNAIWQGDADAVREMVLKDPRLLHEAARGLADSNWGPPMSYAANVGQDQIIQMLREMGATDVQHAFDRACLQGKIETARRLHAMGARPIPGCVMGPCETLNDAGLAFLLELGAELADENGDRLAPVALLLQTYCRYPEGKHRCLELAAEHGVQLPDTPVMALHRGRIDLLAKHLSRDPQLLAQTFSHEDIYPPSLGCSADHSYGLHGTPLAGTTLLHICIDFDEVEIARWLIEGGPTLMQRQRSTPTLSAGTPRCSDVSYRRPTSAGGSGMRPSRAFCSITGPTPTPARRCESSCASSPTKPCTNIATSRRLPGANASMASSITTGLADRRCS